MAGKNLDAYVAIWEQLLGVQRKSRFIGLLAGLEPGRADPTLSFAEALTLLIVECDPDKNVRDLAELLHLERSWVSRIISQLEHRKLVQCHTPEEDRRSRNVRISSRGRLELARLTASRAQVISETYKELSGDEQKELKDFYRRWADGLNAPAYKTTIHTHPLDEELTRLSWAMGSIGENFMQSGMGFTKYHLLHDLAQRADQFTSATEFATLLPVDPSTVSRTLAQFADDGLIERKAASNDARVMLLRISEKGRKLWDEVLDRASQVTGETLRSLSAAEVKRMHTLMAKVNEHMPLRVKQVAAKETDVRAIDAREALDFAKSFFKSGSKISDEWMPLLDPAKGKTFGLFQRSNLCALLHMEKTSDGTAIKTFSVLGKDLNEKECMQFIRNCMRVPHRRTTPKPSR